MQIEVKEQGDLISICDFLPFSLCAFVGGVKDWMAQLGLQFVSCFVFFTQYENISYM